MRNVGNPELAGYLRIEERELEAGGLSGAFCVLAEARECLDC